MGYRRVRDLPAGRRDGRDALQERHGGHLRREEKGQDTYRKYTSRLSVRDARRMAVESGLPRAIERDELVVHYQPIVDLATRGVPRVEALVRWKKSETGFIPPSEFVPIAESSGLIVAVDAWVLRAACAQVAGLSAQSPRLVVSVNLSARQFHQPDLIAQVRGALEDGPLVRRAYSAWHRGFPRRIQSGWPTRGCRRRFTARLTHAVEPVEKVLEA